MPEAGKPCRLMAENDPSSLYRAFIFVKTTPQHVAAARNSWFQEDPSLLYRASPRHPAHGGVYTKDQL
jgi:hypothetical protein